MGMVIKMKERISGQIESVLKELGIKASFVVDYPTDKNADADYYSNVALAVAKESGKAPRDVAVQIKETLEGKINQVESIEVAGPGFLNFKLNRNFFTEKITAALEAQGDWGRNDSL